MKKLALALVCLVSVAFFASCDPKVENPEPSIAINGAEGYVQNNGEINVNTDYLFGFNVASNVETNKELASLVVNIETFDIEGNSVATTPWANVDLTGLTSYSYTDTLYIYFERDELVGSCVISATVTDAAGATNTASINLSIFNPAQLLEAVDFEWYRLGNTQTGLEEYGLYWERNIKSPFAQIKPLNGVSLYSFEASKWDEVKTDADKAALFTDGLITIAVYNKVDVNANGTYDDVIGTRMEDGTLHLIHVTSCVVDPYQSAGTPVHIYGQSK